MIIVTGTMRSGTSLWMQILIAAGFPHIGEAFPKRWKQTIQAANTAGFFESHLNNGIYYETNPDPRTGKYWFPEEVHHHAVKVFIPGLARSDRAYIDKVVATVRHWSEYEASVTRLYQMEDTNRAKLAAAEGKPPYVAPVRMPPLLEWWNENLLLIRDYALRRYPIRITSFDRLLAEPGDIIASTLDWLGSGNTGEAIAIVKPQERTQHRPGDSSLEPGLVPVFDELYDTLAHAHPLTDALVERLFQTNNSLMPRIRHHQEALRADHAKRKRQKSASSKHA